MNEITRFRLFGDISREKAKSEDSSLEGIFG
jgi:hypothetical protein